MSCKECESFVLFGGLVGELGVFKGGGAKSAKRCFSSNIDQVVKRWTITEFGW